MDYPIKELKKEDWPELLHEINDPPKKLYARGNVSFDASSNAFHNTQRLLCVVGSRKYSQYGKSVCEKLIGGLAGYPITIVSGLALGMDAIAHAAALDARLQTIAVPGSGLDWDVLYPKSNFLLAKRILEHDGAFLSEFEPNFKATTWSFPQRNRIMAGMSHAVLIIEATEQSGTLVTARLGMEYNREVFTVPGSILLSHARGSNNLLRQGVTAVTCSEDILEALNIDSRDTIQDSGNTEHLSENERKVLELLDEPLSRDELIRALQIPISDANILLSAMEIKGLISERLGKIMIV